MTKCISILVLMFITSTSVAQTMCVDFFEAKALSWSNENEGLDFNVLTKYMRTKFEEISPIRDTSVKPGKVAWTGPATIKNIFVSQPELVVRFGKADLDYNKERDRDVLDVALMTLAQLGMDVAIEQIKQSPQMTQLTQRAQFLNTRVQQKAITKSEYDQELREILKSLKGIEENHTDIFFDSEITSFSVMIPVQRLILGYYKFPSEGAKNLSLHIIGELFTISQEQGFRTWRKKNEIIFEGVARRIQDRLDESAAGKTELDARDEQTAERIVSSLDILAN